jgi:hypothetical protein
MRKYLATTIGTVVAFAGGGAFAADAAYPNMAGTYRCEAERGYCERGKTFTITQEGAVLRIQNEEGLSGNASLTSNVTLNVHGPWNLTGVITGPNKDRILLSNGTRWVKS